MRVTNASIAMPSPRGRPVAAYFRGSALHHGVRSVLRRSAEFAVAHPKLRRTGAAVLNRLPGVRSLLLRSLVPEIPNAPAPVAVELAGMSPTARRYHAMLQEALKTRTAG